MKKFLAKLLTIVLLLGALYVAYLYFAPQLTVRIAISDIKRNGTESVEKYLAQDAKKVFRTAEVIGDLTKLGDLASFLGDLGAVKTIVDQFSSIDFTIEETLVGLNHTYVVLKCSYQNILSGNIQLVMVREGVLWKLQTLGIPGAI